jgi:hypothetical protein
MVVGSLGTGIPRLEEGKYRLRGMLTTLSQKGNVAHVAQGAQQHKLRW